jgi:hypothetical protein
MTLNRSRLTTNRKQDGPAVFDPSVSLSVCPARQVLMRQVPKEELDMLCGGHDHFYARDEELRIVKGGQEFQYIVDMEFEVPAEPGLAKLLRCDKVEITEDLGHDKDMTALDQKWLDVVAKRAKEVDGKCEVDICSRVRARESPSWSRAARASEVDSSCGLRICL